MEHRIVKTEQGDSLWPHIASHSPQTVRWVEDPEDDGNYHCFLALGNEDEVLGFCVIDIAPLAFGPLAEHIIGFLEELLVFAQHRRKGIGTSLLDAALSAAWQREAQHVRWVVDYENAPALALSSKAGAAFIPEEDPEAAEPENCYTAVTVNPKLHGEG